MFVADTLVVIGLATISLGTIHEADGTKEHSYWLRNAGLEAVALVQGYTSCGCTTIQYAKDVAVAPGDSTCVTLRFNPRGKGGEFEETGTIVYKSLKSDVPQSMKSEVYSQRKRISVSMAGTCITSEETLLRQFPIRISDRLRLSTDRFDLGIMHPGETKERTVVVLHRGDADRQERLPIRFTVTADTPKGLQHIAWPLKIGNETVTVTLDVLCR